MASTPKPILVATDGSTAAEHAVRYAATLAKRRGTELVLLHIISLKKVGYWGFIDTHFKKELRQAASKILRAVQRKKNRLIPGVDAHLVHTIKKLFPGSYPRIVHAIFSRATFQESKR